MIQSLSSRPHYRNCAPQRARHPSGNSRRSLITPPPRSLEATSGKRLPSEALVKAFATGCGADPAEWTERLQRAATRARQRTAPRARPSLAARWRRHALNALLAIGLLALGAVLGVLYQARHAATAKVTAFRPEPRPSRNKPGPATDGEDPGAVGCAADARVAARSPVTLDGVQIGTLKFLYSPACQAGWARAYLAQGQPTMLGEVSVAAADGRMSAFAYPLVKQVPVYTDVLTPGPRGCLATHATFYPRNQP